MTIPGSGSLDLTGAMTLEAWVQPDALGSTWRTVLFKEQPTGMEYSLYANDESGHPIGQAQIGGEQNVVGPRSVPMGAWTYLAATYNGSAERLYVNGAPVARSHLTGSIEVSDGNLRIGGNAIWPEWFSGLIDEVRIYNHALSQSDIQTDMVTPVSAIPVSQPVPPAVVGEQHVEPDSHPPNASGIAEAYSTVAQSSDTIESIRVYVDSETTAQTLFAGIYSDDRGHPGKLLASGSLDGPLPNAWNTVAVPARRVAAGTTYWIAVLGGDGGQLAYRDRCCSVAGTGPTETEAGTSLSELPAHWTTGIVYDDGPISAFATG